MPDDFEKKKWILADGDERLREELAKGLGASSILAQILINRAIDSVDAGKKFLRPELDQLHDPDLLPDMRRAAERIVEAVQAGERIVIYGDYDVDGISATALLMQCLRLPGANVGYYIPERLEEGYGLNVGALRRLRDDGASVVIAVDCGIGALEEAKLAKELGLTLIITDHHEPGPDKPDAYAVIDPKLPGGDYPFTELSGVGVAFKLAWSIGKTFSRSDRVSEEFREFLLRAVALVALGTVADVVPLSGENRVLVKYGLMALDETTSPGIQALLSEAQLKDAPRTARDIAFGLGPRINAAGRLGDPRRAVEMLITDSYGEAAEIAKTLDERNRERQDIGRAILAEAEEKILAEVDLANDRTIVLADAGWHVGVIGIVASKLAEKYYRPTIMLSVDGGVAQGSARSIPEFHLYNGLEACRALLLTFGGHAQAAGLRLSLDKLDEFRSAIQDYVAQKLNDDDLVPKLNIDAEVDLASVNEALASEIERLRPFGHGNREPVLAAYGVKVAGKARRLGSDGKHLSFNTHVDAGPSFRTIAFGMGELADRVEAATDGFDIAFVPKINEWRGHRNVELEIRDIRFKRNA